MRNIINSSCITLDGVVEAPQPWRSSGRPGDDRTGRMQSDLLLSCDVVSRTVENPGWANTSVMDGDAADEIGQLKRTPDRDIVQYGFGAVRRRCSSTASSTSCGSGCTR
jgi:hypothetical protein